MKKSFKNIYLYMVLSLFILFGLNCKKKEEAQTSSKNESTAFNSTSSTNVFNSNQEIEIESIKASSTLENKEKYEAKNLTYGENSWCEGKPDEGINEILTVKFEKEEKIEWFNLINGFGDPNFYTQNARVASLEVIGNNGEKETIEILDSSLPQKYILKTPIKSNQIQFKINKVHLGAKYKDTCIFKLSFKDDLENSIFPYNEKIVKNYLLRKGGELVVKIYHLNSHQPELSGDKDVSINLTIDPSSEKGYFYNYTSEFIQTVEFGETKLTFNAWKFLKSTNEGTEIELLYNEDISVTTMGGETIREKEVTTKKKAKVIINKFDFGKEIYYGTIKLQ